MLIKEDINRQQFPLKYKKFKEDVFFCSSFKTIVPPLFMGVFMNIEALAFHRHFIRIPKPL